MTTARLLTGILIWILAAPVVAKTESLSGFSDTQVETTLALLDKLATQHYSAQPVDDAMSRELLANYLDALDPAKNYFLASDIQKWDRYKTRLDDKLRQGDVSAGFEIFNVYKARVLDRLNNNIKLLQDFPNFDFSKHETLDIEIEDNVWASSMKELDEYWLRRVKDSYLRLLLADKDEKDIPDILIKRYKNQIKRVEKMDAEDIYQLYINAFTTLYDPHTNYFSPRQLDNFNISMSLSLEGIGAVLQTVDENTQVVRIVPGGPADQHGVLLPEDIIVGVGQGKEDIQDVVGWRLEDVVDLIRGKKGTTVQLEIIPAKGESAGVNKTLAIIRDEVKLEEQAAKSRIIDLKNADKDYKVGVIDIPAFYIDFEAYHRRDPNFKSTTRDVAKLLAELDKQNVDGIVIDLRNNGGGSLQEATTLTDLFIPPGPVVQIRQTNQMISRQYRSRSKPVYDGPLLVLINRLSASASEIFAGAIQDYGRGLVVGTQSYGKGTVQSLLPLPQGQLKLTESKFYRVSGESTQHRGVVPDIAFPSLFSLDDIGESSQDHALPWDKIHGIPIKKSAEIRSIVSLLQKKHDVRALKDPDFVFLTDELAFRDSKLGKLELSLDLETRKAERSEGEEAIFEFENKRRKAKGLAPYTSLDDWKKNNSSAEDEDVISIAAEEENDVIPLEDDPLLKEAGMILTDQILLIDGGSRHQIAENANQP